MAHTCATNRLSLSLDPEIECLMFRLRRRLQFQYQMAKAMVDDTKSST